MTRTGKIARLPREIREQLNRRLQNGEQAKRLVVWLNSLPEVKAVLKKEFRGRPLSEQNLSEWKNGGFRDWLAQQQAMEMVQRLSADADELKQATTEPLTEKLALWIAARYAVAAEALPTEGERGSGDWKLLRELCNDLVALRRGDHSAERLKLERERLVYDKDLVDVRFMAAFMKWLCGPGKNESFCVPPIDRETLMRRIEKLMFSLWDDVEANLKTNAASQPAPGAGPAAPTESNQIKPNGIL